MTNDFVIIKDSSRCVRTLLTLLDLSAVFDTVDQCILKSMLNDISFCGDLLSWFKIYQQHRKFFVCVGEDTYSSAKMGTRISQGTDLIPILFHIYTADFYHLLEGLGAPCNFFADDTHFCCKPWGKLRLS